MTFELSQSFFLCVFFVKSLNSISILNSTRNNIRVFNIFQKKIFKNQTFNRKILLLSDYREIYS